MAVPLDNLALRLLREVQARWERAAAAVHPIVAPAEAHGPMSQLPAPHGYRHAATPSIKVGLRATPPDAVEAAVAARVNIACDDASPFHFQLETLETHDRIDIREADLAPDLSTHLELLLELWVDRHLTHLLVKRGTQAGRAQQLPSPSIAAK